MSDKAADTPGEFFERQSNNTEGTASLLDEYADVITDYQSYALDAERFAKIPTVIGALNSQLDKSKDAFYAELAMNSSTYSPGDAEGTWKPSHRFSVQGATRPFIGDKLIITDDALLLVDSARQVGVGHFNNLQIRSKEDADVRHFSQEGPVGIIRKIGELATEKDTTILLVRNRWGQEEIHPPLT